MLAVGTGALALILFAADRQAALYTRASWLPGAVAGIVYLLVTIALQLKLLPGLQWIVPAAGLVAIGAVLAVLAQEERGSRGQFHPLALIFAAVMAVVAAVVISYHVLHGYGEALALLPAMLFLAPLYVETDEEALALTSAVGFGAVTLVTVFALSRLLFHNTGFTQALDFQRQYDTLAVLLGVGMTVGILATWQGYRRDTLTLGAPLLRTLLLGALVIATPFTIGILWGMKSLTALLMGLAIGDVLWLLLAAWSKGEERVRALAAAPHVFVLAAVLITVQLAAKVIALNFSRPQKITLVLVIVVLAAVWVLVDTILRLRQQGKESTDASA